MNEPGLVSDPPRAAAVTELLKAVAHPLRLRLVALLRVASHNVSGLATALDVPPAIISQQLRILRMSGLVEATRKAGSPSTPDSPPEPAFARRCGPICGVRLTDSRSEHLDMPARESASLPCTCTPGIGSGAPLGARPSRGIWVYRLRDPHVRQLIDCVEQCSVPRFLDGDRGGAPRPPVAEGKDKEDR